MIKFEQNYFQDNFLSTCFLASWHKFLKSQTSCDHYSAINSVHKSIDIQYNIHNTHLVRETG